MTPFETKTQILADLWMDYRGDEEFSDFLEYNDLGLPLAYAISSGIVNSSPLAQQYIEETFELLLAAVKIEEDTGFEALEDILGLAI
jgi:hypothetical protein